MSDAKKIRYNVYVHEKKLAVLKKLVAQGRFDSVSAAIRQAIDLLLMIEVGDYDTDVDIRD